MKIYIHVEGISGYPSKTVRINVPDQSSGCVTVRDLINLFLIEYKKDNPSISISADNLYFRVSSPDGAKLRNHSNLSGGIM